MRRRNFREPATLQRSPTLTKLFSGVMVSSSKPETLNAGFISGATLTTAFEAASESAAI